MPIEDHRDTETLKTNSPLVDSLGEFEEIITAWRRKTGLHVVVAIHSVARGPALGGTRYRSYPDHSSAVADACALARAMTYKAAVANLPLGGGKAVIIGDPRQSKTLELLAEYADVLNSLKGRYITAEDVGTAEDDMDFLGTLTPHVAGRSTESGGSGDPSPFTAYGVLCAMEAAAFHRWGDRDLTKKHVAINGLGKVGSGLAHLLLDRGCTLTVADLSRDALANLAGLPDVSVSEPDQIHNVSCDIYAPCAVGGDINDRTVPELRCEMVIGAANNQLAAARIAEDLRDLDILYVPDYVANAGGLINIANEIGDYDSVRSMAQVAGIFETVGALCNRAQKEGVTPLSAAEAIAEDHLAF
jgi:glutamate dehydrogenase/leucine dehydrogenase